MIGKRSCWLRMGTHPRERDRTLCNNKWHKCWQRHIRKCSQILCCHSTITSRSKPKPRLPFSVEAFDDSIGLTDESAQFESTLNESGNANEASDGLSQADILELLQNNPPSGYKYCLTFSSERNRHSWKCVEKLSGIYKES